MSSSSIRRALELKRQQRVNADKKAADFRKRESEKRTAATKARESASRSSSTSTIRMRLAEAQRREDEANHAGSDVAAWQRRSADFSKEEARLTDQLAKAEASERDAAERQVRRDAESAARLASRQRREFDQRLTTTELAVAEIRAPMPEKLRVLILSAAPEGDLRVGREQKRIQQAIRSAYGRDLIELDVRPAATPTDLIDGLTYFRPHVVHFTGHSSDTLIQFELDVDEPNTGVIISASAFARALEAVDVPPSLVVLNSCDSAGQAAMLVQGNVLLAVGMAASVEDGDAINYAARFYAAIADGQSVGSAHELAKTELEMSGASGADLPTLSESIAGAGATVLVLRPDLAPEPRDAEP